jgi:hypothetical protein
MGPRLPSNKLLMNEDGRFPGFRRATTGADELFLCDLQVNQGTEMLQRYLLTLSAESDPGGHLRQLIF